MQKFLKIINLFMKKTELIRQKVIYLLASMGISKTKLGEILGSQSKNTQAKIDRANRFLKNQKSISIDEINAIAKLFNRPFYYFLEEESPIIASVAEDSYTYYDTSKIKQIEQMDEKEINQLLQKIRKESPEVLHETSNDVLSLIAKRAILKAYYRKF